MGDALRGSPAREPIRDPNLEPHAPRSGSEVKAPKEAPKTADSAAVDRFETGEQNAPDLQKSVNASAAQKPSFRERISQLWQSLLEALGIRKPATTPLGELHAVLDAAKAGNLGTYSDELESIMTALKASPLLTDQDFLQLKRDLGNSTRSAAQ